MSKQTFKQNDRVEVSDGPGFTLGQGTVLAFYPSEGPGYDDLVEVSLDNDGRTILVNLDRVKKVVR